MAKPTPTQEDCNRIIREMNRDVPPGVICRPADHITLEFEILPTGAKFNEDVISSQGGRRPGVVSGSFAGPDSGERCRSEADKTSERQQEENRNE